MALDGNHSAGQGGHVADHNLIDTAFGLRLIAVDHGATAGTARPTSTLPVKWFGTVAPTNAVTNDEWYDRSAEVLKRYTGSAWALAGSGTFAPLASPALTGTPTVNGAGIASIAGNTFTNTQEIKRDADGTAAPELHLLAYRRNWAVGTDVADATRPTSGFFIARYGQRRAYDVVTTSGSPTVTSAADAMFGNFDVGAAITGTGIPGGTTVLSVNAAGTSATMSANATVSGTVPVCAIGGAGVNDIFYISDNGGYGASVGIGKPQPDKTFRLQLQSDAQDLTQGGLRILPTPSATGDMVNIGASVGATQFRIASDFAMMVQSSPSNYAETNGSTASNTTVTLSSVTADYKMLGLFITGTGIPTGAYITAVNAGANTVTISAAATATASGLALTIYRPLMRVQNNGFTPYFQVHPGSGGGAILAPVGLFGIGPGVPALPGATLHIATTSTNNAAILLKTASQGGFGITSGGATAKVILGTTNGSQLIFATNSSLNPSSINGQAMLITAAASTLIGVPSLALSATDGFPYLPVVAGTPTGAPTAQTGFAAVVLDSTGSKLWAYIGGAWKSVTLA